VVRELRHKRSRASQQFKSKRPPQKRKSAGCKEEIDLIAAYLGDDLPSAARSEFETHLKACPDCAAFLATYKKTIAITRSFLQRHSPKKCAPELSLHR
jgi:anti-sigma factor RsiW